MVFVKYVLKVIRYWLWTLWYVLTGRLLMAMLETKGTSAPVTFKVFWQQKILGANREVPWPVSPESIVGSSDKIKIGVGCAPGLGPWCYIQGKNGIEFGDYTLVAPRVSVISANHDIHDIHRHVSARPIKIGAYCWLGVNSTILPEVELGPHTIVAAGAVVTKSFPKGYCVLAGTPARIVKELDSDKVIEHKNRHAYVGYRKVV